MVLEVWRLSNPTAFPSTQDLSRSPPRCGSVLQIRQIKVTGKSIQSTGYYITSNGNFKTYLYLCVCLCLVPKTNGLLLGDLGGDMSPYITWYYWTKFRKPKIRRKSVDLYPLSSHLLLSLLPNVPRSAIFFLTRDYALTISRQSSARTLWALSGWAIPPVPPVPGSFQNGFLLAAFLLDNGPHIAVSCSIC